MIGSCFLLPEGQITNNHLLQHLGRIHSNRVNSLCQLYKFCYGFTNVITQPTWRSILFCVYELVHWSKNIAVLSYILPSLFKRASTNEWQTWRHHMPGMSKKVSSSRERLSQRAAGQLSNEDFVRCHDYSKMQRRWSEVWKLRKNKCPKFLLL